MHLEFGDDFNKQLTLGVLPPNLTHLTFGYFFNREIAIGVLPGHGRA